MARDEDRVQNDGAAGADDAQVDEAATIAAVASAAEVAERERIRERLQDDVEAFLARGGKIEDVPNVYRADPPKKPQSNYGSRSI